MTGIKYNFNNFYKDNMDSVKLLSLLFVLCAMFVLVFTTQPTWQTILSGMLGGVTAQLLTSEQFLDIAADFIVWMRKK